MNIIDILRERGIPYIESGKNVKHGNINIHCVWCGADDKSYHMGINPETGAFACWRNMQHRGPKIHGLLMKLLGCSREAVQALLTDTSDLRRVVARLEARGTADAEAEPVSVNVPGLRRLSPRSEQAKFHSYLMQRGYHYEHIGIMSDIYDLHVGMFGELCNRLVFPLHVDDKLIGFTGRAIDNSRLRYYSHPGPIVKQNVLWFDLLRKGGRRLYVCEGPFDAMRVDYISRIEGLPDRATCMFGVSYTQQQLTRLHCLAADYDELVILFDRVAMPQAIQLDQALSLGKSRIQTLQEGVKDPGELEWAAVIRLAGRNPTGANETLMDCVV
jgi:hypothetical protein